MFAPQRNFKPIYKPEPMQLGSEVKRPSSQQLQNRNKIRPDQNYRAFQNHFQQVDPRNNSPQELYYLEQPPETNEQISPPECTEDVQDVEYLEHPTYDLQDTEYSEPSYSYDPSVDQDYFQNSGNNEDFQ